MPRIFNRNIAEEAHERLHAMGDDEGIRTFAFHPDGGWVLITRENDRFARNIPDECYEKLKEFKRRGHQVLWIAFPPGGGNAWSIVTDRGYYNRNVPGELHRRMGRVSRSGHQILCVAFPPRGGNAWSTVTDRGYYNRNVPGELHRTMADLRRNGHNLRSVAFDPDGGWVVLTDRGFAARAVPDECFEIMETFEEDGDRVTLAAFDPDRRGWSVISNDTFTPTEPTKRRSEWHHTSPIPDHVVEADLDLTSREFPAFHESALKFALAGDFDGDGHDELVVANTFGGSLGNDFWAMEFDDAADGWEHMSPLVGNDAEADFSCSSTDVRAEFGVVGDFDGDGCDEVAIAPTHRRSGGNDFWTMRFDEDRRLWTHMARGRDHPFEADLDCSNEPYPAKFAVVGDFDGDGRDEVVVAPEAGGSKANDLWAMEFDPDDHHWRHMSPISGHPMDADIDCSSEPIGVSFGVAGDFDGDGRDELALAMDESGSSGNDFWVMEFDPDDGSWRHMSPISGHANQADLDCTSEDIAARFGVAGDFDGDGRDELAVAPASDGSAGNDFWIVEFDSDHLGWRHTSPREGHPIDADLDCSPRKVPAAFAVAGDYDGDGIDELAIAADSPFSAGNDFWIAGLDNTWSVIDRRSGHPLGATFDCSARPNPAMFAVAGRFGSGGPADRDELAIAIRKGRREDLETAAARGPNLWVMRYYTESPEVELEIEAEIRNVLRSDQPDIDGTDITQEVELEAIYRRDRNTIRLRPFDPIRERFDTDFGENTTTVTFVDNGRIGEFNPDTGRLEITIDLRYEQSLPVPGDDLTVDLSTDRSIPMPEGVVRGARWNAETGAVRLVGAGDFRGGFLANNDTESFLVVDGILPDFRDTGTIPLILTDPTVNIRFPPLEGF